MPRFRYTAVGPDGRAIAGEIEALDPAAAAAEFGTRGVMLQSLDRLAGSAQSAYGQAADTVRNTADRVMSQGGDYGSQVLDQIEEAGDYLAEQVDNRPITSILIAAGVGFLIALATKPAPVYYRRR